jgi:hypothetical protein
MIMPVSKAQQKAVKKYMAKNYYRPSIMLKRDYETDIKDRAKDLDMSMSEYIQTLIKTDLEQHIL